MYQTILVPLDGSPFAEQALPLALALARQAGAALRLVHVREPQAPQPAVPSTSGEPYPWQLAQLIAGTTDLGVEGVLLEGKASDELVGYIAREGIELACIATHGRGGLSRTRLGSTADELIRHLRIPVVAMRPMEEREMGEAAAGGAAGGGSALAIARHLTTHKPIERILVPLDGSPLAEAVLGHVVALDNSALQVSLVQAIPAPVPNDPASLSLVLTTDQSTIEAELTAALAYLDRVADRISRHVRRVDTAVLLEPQPLAAILDYADQHEVDMIAIATHGRGGLGRLALGSMADKILRAANVPVLVFRPGEP